MRVVRGRADTRRADHAATRALLDVAAGGERAVRVWAPARQVAFGRRDARESGFAAAERAARERGYPPVVRDVGGRAVAYTGTTLAFARADPVGDFRAGLGERYEGVLKAVQRALWSVGVPAQRGEPPASFCPGSHSLQYRGKLAGVGQRVTADAALTAGVLVVDDRDALAAVLDAVYDALGVPLDPETVGSVERAGGDAARVERAVEDALVGGEDADVVSVRALRQL